MSTLVAMPESAPTLAYTSQHESYDPKALFRLFGGVCGGGLCGVAAGRLFGFAFDNGGGGLGTWGAIGLLACGMILLVGGCVPGVSEKRCRTLLMAGPIGLALICLAMAAHNGYMTHELPPALACIITGWLVRARNPVVDEETTPISERIRRPVACWLITWGLCNMLSYAHFLFGIGQYAQGVVTARDALVRVLACTEVISVVIREFSGPVLILAAILMWRGRFWGCRLALWLCWAWMGLMATHWSIWSQMLLSAGKGVHSCIEPTGQVVVGFIDVWCCIVPLWFLNRTRTQWAKP